MKRSCGWYDRNRAGLADTHGIQEEKRHLCAEKYGKSVRLMLSSTVSHPHTIHSPLCRRAFSACIGQLFNLADFTFKLHLILVVDVVGAVPNGLWAVNAAFRSGTPNSCWINIRNYWWLDMVENCVKSWLRGKKKRWDKNTLRLLSSFH